MLGADLRKMESRVFSEHWCRASIDSLQTKQYCWELCTCWNQNSRKRAGYNESAEKLQNALVSRFCKQFSVIIPFIIHQTRYWEAYAQGRSFEGLARTKHSCRFNFASLLKIAVVPKWAMGNWSARTDWSQGGTTEGKTKEIEISEQFLRQIIMGIYSQKVSVDQWILFWIQCFPWL